MYNNQHMKRINSRFVGGFLRHLLAIRGVKFTVFFNVYMHICTFWCVVCVFWSIFFVCKETLTALMLIFDIRPVSKKEIMEIVLTKI